jgi:4-amino-4-deoxy-L-arabinose transferase-like glycosyltransferase
MASAEMTPASKLSQATAPRWFPSRRQLFLALAAYFGWHLLCRTLISSSVDLDESEQFVLTQRLLWGYGSQPPLYTWMQSAFFHVLGMNILALSLLKNLLLFSIAALTYANARRITRSHACGVVAVMALAFVPHFVWESQRDLTHSVLASALALATLYTFLHLAEKPRALKYCLLGMCMGLGTLSKYNYVFFPLGLFAAVLTVTELRRVVLDRRMLLALISALVMVLPNGLWMYQHSTQALHRVNKFQIQEHISWLSAVGTGFKDMGLSVLLFVTPMTLVLTLVFWKSRGKAKSSTTPLVKLTGRILPGVLAAVTLLILGFRVTDVKERWFQPLLIIAPVVAATWLQPRLNQKRLNWLVGLAGLVALVVIAAIPGRYFLAERLHREETLTRPYATLAQKLDQTLAPHTTIVAATPLLAGNLRLHLPTRTVTTPELVELFAYDPQNVVLTWEANRNPALPARLSDFAARQGLGEVTNQSPAYVSAPYYFGINKQARLGSVKRESKSESTNAPATATTPQPR